MVPEGGVRIGHWKLERLIDTGGSGSVWRAQHEVHGSEAAIKILRGHDGISETDAIPFLVREVAAASRVFHPNIVNLLDYGIVEQGSGSSAIPTISAGSPYMAFQYERGGSLHEWRGRMPWARLRGTILAVLDGLSHIHARGLLHLDIKPANLLFEDTDCMPSGIRIADFGIAMLRPFTMMFEEKRLDLYHTDDIHGSAAYMAPEQFALNFIDFTHSTDLYALAVTVWEMVSGKIPMAELSLPDRIQNKKRHCLPPVQNVIPVPHGLDRWLQRMTNPSVADRLQTAADAAHSLMDISAPIVVSGRSSALTTTGSLPTTNAPQAAVLSRRRKQKASTPVGTLPRVEFERQPTDIRGHHRRYIRYDVLIRPPTATPPAMPGGAAGTEPVWRADRVDRLAPSVPVRSDDEREHLWQVLRRVHALASPEAVLIEHTPDSRGQALSRWLVESAEQGGHAHGIRLRYRNDARPAQGLSFLVCELFNAIGFPPDVLTQMVREQLTALSLDRYPLLDELIHWALTSSTQPEFDRADDLDALSRFAQPLAYILGGVAHQRPVVFWVDNLLELAPSTALLQALLNLPSGGSPVMTVVSMSEGLAVPLDLMLRPNLTVLQRPMHGGVASTAHRVIGDLCIDVATLAHACLRSGDIGAAEALLDRAVHIDDSMADSMAQRRLSRWQTMELQGDIAEARGELAVATEDYAQAIAVLFEGEPETMPDPIRYGDVALKYARTLRRTGKAQRGLNYAHRARTIYDSVNAGSRVAAAEFELGQLYFERGRWELSHERYADAASLAERSHDYGLLALARLGIARCRLLRTGYTDASGLDDLLRHPGAASPSCQNRTWLAMVRHLARTNIARDELQQLSITHIVPLYERLSLPAALETISLDLAVSNDRSPEQVLAGLNDLAAELMRTGVARFMIAEDLVLLSRLNHEQSFNEARIEALRLAAHIYRQIGLESFADRLARGTAE